MQICAIQFAKDSIQKAPGAEGIGFITDSPKKCPERVAGQALDGQIETCPGSAQAAGS